MASLADSRWGNHLLAIQADLIAADLELIRGNVKIRKFPWLRPVHPNAAGVDRDVTPIAIVTSLRETANAREGHVNQQDFHLRALVALIIAANKDLESNLGTEELWRETLFRRYTKETRLRSFNSNAANVMTSVVEPGVPRDAEAFVNKNYDAMYVVINSRIRTNFAV